MQSSEMETQHQYVPRGICTNQQGKALSWKTLQSRRNFQKAHHIKEPEVGVQGGPCTTMMAGAQLSCLQGHAHSGWLLKTDWGLKDGKPASVSDWTEGTSFTPKCHTGWCASSMEGSKHGSRCWRSVLTVPLDLFYFTLS